MGCSLGLSRVARPVVKGSEHYRCPGGAAVLALPVVTLEESGRQGRAGPFRVFPKRGRLCGSCFSNMAGDPCPGAWARGRRRADSATPRPVCDLWCQLSWSRLSGKSWNTHTPGAPQQVPWFARGTPGTQYTVISWLGLGAAQSYKAGLCKGRRCVGGARGNQEQVSGGLPVVATQEHHLPACWRLRAQAAHIGTLCRAPGPRLPGEAGLGTESHPDRLGSHGNPPQVQVPRCRPRADPRHSLGPAHHLLIPFQGLTCLRPSPLDLLPERGQS